MAGSKIDRKRQRIDTGTEKTERQKETERDKET